MRLRHITFTGIDAKTDIMDLAEIQKQYPLVEFGVLTSYHWYENGNRYLDPRLLRNFRTRDGRIGETDINLSLHICGRAAHDAAYGDWWEIDHLTYGNLKLFNRFQLNVAERQDNPPYVKTAPYNWQQMIIQQRNVNELGLLKATLRSYPFHESFAVLLDASGGRGIDTPIEVLKGQVMTGYAGGINPDNVADKLAYLLQQENKGDFWIDMESGVRTDDWFDIEKASRVLAICKEVMRDLHVED